MVDKKIMDKKRNTVQRSLVLNAVKELNTHATAEQVYDHVSKLHPSISKATVYRNLNQMAELGELLNIGNIHGSTRYEPNSNEHYHFICKDCKRVYDVHGDYSHLANHISDEHGFEVHDVNLSFTGYCSQCNGD